MSRRARLFLVIFVGTAILAVLVLLGLFVAVQHEPAFYRKAMQIDPAVLEKGSDQMLRKIAALQSALAKPGHWQAVITADEINGWLAVDLAKNHPNTLPPSASDPRVVISPSEIILACRFEQSGTTTVLSLAVRPYIPEPNVVALRIIRARAGALPVPLQRILDGLSQAAADMQFRLDWRHAGSDPVALISFPDDGNRVVRIESLQLSDGEIRIVGTTERRTP